MATPNEIDDARHLDDSPMPWLRYFFPKDFDAREGGVTNPYYQYFDVRLEDMKPDLAVPPPEWAPNSFYRLSFTQTNLRKEQALTGSETVIPPSCMDAIDVTKGGAKVFDIAAERHLEEVKTFCKACASFKPKTWKDAFPLVDLLRALLLYLLQQMMAGQKIAEEKARKQMLELLEQEKKKMAADLASGIEAARKEAADEADARLQKALENMRKTVGEEFQSMIRADRDEKERALSRAQLAEMSLKKVKERADHLQTALEGKEAELQAEKAETQHSLGRKDRQIDDLRKDISSLQLALSKARVNIIDALNSQTKQEIIDVATDAIANLIPGAAGYIAELKTVQTIEKDSADELAELLPQPADGSSALLDAAAANITPGFLFSPWAAPDPNVTSKSNPMTPGGTMVTGTGDNDAKEDLLFKYVQASEGQEFMLGTTLSPSQGVSWALIDNAADVYVEDVTLKPNMHFFRSSQQHGAYLAVPIKGRGGELLGMLCADTLVAKPKDGAEVVAKVLTDPERLFVSQLADAISAACKRDQEALVTCMLKETGEPEPPMGPIDPTRYADYDGGMKMFHSAVLSINNFTEEQLNEFKNISNPDDTTMAILRSVLTTAGDMVEGDWLHVRTHISKSLIGKLTAMSPEDAWAEWSSLCTSMKPVFGGEMYGNLPRLEAMLEEEKDIEKTGKKPMNAVVHGFATWLVGVRQLAAAREVARQVEAKLKKANNALLKTFAGDGCSALVELKSYRVPPKNTLSVLQAALLLAGCSNDDVHNWGKMRMLTNYKIIKVLVDLKPKKVPKGSMSHVNKLINVLSEDDVRKESLATLALFRWLVQFIQVYESLKGIPDQGLPNL